MRLDRPFQRLGVRFDEARLREEISLIPPSAWVAHPNGIPGNSSVRLISVDGGENDEVNGPMAMTPHLRQSPYLRQVLASFGVVWGRSRLMRLAPGAEVPSHADINQHWFTRVRIHIPVVTRPEVTFQCGDEVVHMAPGEAWLFDNWRLHRVENPTPDERIHLVADTSGSASFWQFAARSLDVGVGDVLYRYDPQRPTALITEQTMRAPVMHPAEVETMIRDLRSELVSTEDSPAALTRLTRYHTALDNFCKDWRQIYAVHGERRSGRGELDALREGLRTASRQLAPDLVMQTNRVNAHTVLEARILRSALTPEPALERPVFIVAAPRSGSTLLYETLAVNHRLSTLGGEAHWLIEGVPELQLGAPGVTSNRLTAAQLSGPVESQILAMIREQLVDNSGRPAELTPATRLLEKTPKNALRIPFLARLFPDARFIFLWREPRGNVSSIIEAWRSGNWKTYNGLDDFEGPWSLVLPPDWQTMNGRPLEEIAAYQWETTNRIVLEDLQALDPQRWTDASYDELLTDPSSTLERLCRFIDVEVDDALRRRLASALPPSRYTDTPPAAGKWQKNADLLDRVMPRVDATWQRLRALHGSPKV
jgi:hypothetical protein